LLLRPHAAYGQPDTARRHATGRRSGATACPRIGAIPARDRSRALPRDAAATPPAFTGTPLWKRRDFILLWGGQLVSWIGTEITGIALPLVVLALTGSPAQAGGIAAVRGAVYVVWAVPAGVVIDRLDRRVVMVVANLGSALAIGSVVLALALGHLSLAHLYVAGAIEGSCFVFANLGRFASLPMVVPREQFPAAAAQTGTADHLALLVGPSLGGFLYQAAGATAAFALDACSYVANAVSIFFIDVPLNAATPAARTAVRHEVADAARWLWHQPVLRFLTLVTAGRTIVSAGLYLLVVVLARERGASALSIGAIIAVGAAGGILGSLVSARLHGLFTMKQLVLGTNALSVLAFGLYAAAANDALLATVTACYFALDPTYVVATSSYSARTIPDAIRGKVTSLTRLVVLGAHSLGFALTGVAIQSLGTDWTIGAGSSLLLVLCLFVLRNRTLAQVA